jgi:hypothetical protein
VLTCARNITRISKKVTKKVPSLSAGVTLDK